MSNIKKRWDDVPNWAKYTLYAVLGIAGAFLLGLLFGNLIMWLWNWLMPSLFGLRTIGFWEGLGLFLLAKILFGFGSSGGSGEGDKKHHKPGKRHHRCGEDEKRDWKDWEYYDDWWEADGKTAFHSYAENMKKEPEAEKKAEEKSE
ncbi:MAG: hypothetical protein Q8S22_11595 [Eubacteriales bacterium]|jgi:hypothetical protein|nr:hypothetical protein [Eubacteriales bacterium]